MDGRAAKLSVVGMAWDLNRPAVLLQSDQRIVDGANVIKAALQNNILVSEGPAASGLFFRHPAENGMVNEPFVSVNLCLDRDPDPYGTGTRKSTGFTLH